jgi:hypothetical protein
MSIIPKIFRRPVKATDLRLALHEVDRRRRHEIAGLRRLGARQRITIERIRVARRAGEEIEVDYRWQELRSLRLDVAHARRALRTSNLERIGLARYLRGLERLENRGESDRARELVDRIRSSDLDSKLAAREVREDEYLAELDTIFDEVGVEVDALEPEALDPDKDLFLQEIDALNEAEEGGQVETALEHEGTIRALAEGGV